MFKKFKQVFGYVLRAVNILSPIAATVGLVIGQPQVTAAAKVAEAAAEMGLKELEKDSQAD